jgi:hypothetical protein
MNAADRSKRAAATFQQRLGEAGYAEYMRQLRGKRRELGGPWRLGYVDGERRTGSQLAAEAGRVGGKARKRIRQQRKG